MTIAGARYPSLFQINTRRSSTCAVHPPVEEIRQAADSPEVPARGGLGVSAPELPQVVRPEPEGRAEREPVNASLAQPVWFLP